MNDQSLAENALQKGTEVFLDEQAASGEIDAEWRNAIALRIAVAPPAEQNICWFVSCVKLYKRHSVKW